MEAENDEKIKRHDNPFSLQSIILTVQVSAFLAAVGYACYPTSINLRQAFSDWFDCFRLVLGNLFFIFLFLNALIGLIYYFGKTTGKKKPDLYDEYIAAVPSVVRYSTEQYFPPMKVGDYGGGYYNHSGYPETLPPFEEVNTVEESHSYDRVLVMETNSKSYRRTRSEKKLRSTLEYRRTESERVMKTTSSRSQSMDELSSEEFRKTVESFIMKRKKIHYSQSGVADHWQNYGVPKLQNGGVDQWQTVAPHLQEQSDSGGTGRHRHRSRRLVGGSGSTGSGHPYLAISN